jgi:hypothetical protein
MLDSSPHYKDTEYKFEVEFETKNALPDDASIKLIFANVKT